MTVDPIVLALTQNRLDDISRRMGEVMLRTAHSPIFSQYHDFSNFIADAGGTLVSQADGVPIQSGNGGFAVRALLEAFGGDIHDGDVFLSNDPYAAGGNHLPDWVVFQPAFAEGRLVAFACNRGHQSDIGGGAPGTVNPEATEIFHEGIRLPPLRIVEKGRVREDLWRLLLINSRTPRLQDGDLRAMIGSTRIGAEAVAALASELGAGRALACFDGILDHADRRFRAALRALPDGRYEGLEITDNDCFESVDIAIRAAVTVAGDAVTVDFTGTDPQIRGFKNSSVANTHAAVYLAFTTFFDPDIPRNEGTYRAIEVVAPEGTVVNARPPAPMTMCTVSVGHEIVHAVWKALARADPSRASAGWAKNIHGGTAGGIGTDRPFVIYHWNAMAGAGAVRGRDGFNQIGHLISLGGLTLPNVEGFERAYPMRIRKVEFRADSAGPGTFRGGTGVDYEAEVDGASQHSFRGEGLATPSGYGTLGGGDGAKGEMTMYPEDGAPFAPPQYGNIEIGSFRIAASSPGGGGWGDPLEREPGRVLRDARDGVISRSAARDVYGVAIGADGRSVDAAATRRRRDALRAERAPAARRSPAPSPRPSPARGDP